MAEKLSILIEKIERQLNWGKGDQWSIQDFEALREKILTSTGQSISVTTLKRIWGKARQDSALSKSTLNILAQFAGFQNWHHFAQGVATAPVINTKFLLFILIGLLALGLGLAWWFFASQKKLAVDHSNMEFSVRKTSSGFPAPVEFNYAFKSAFSEGFEIDQDWPESTPLMLSESEGTLSSTYYLPGYYEPKVIKNGITLDSQRLLIATEGWMGILNNSSVQFPVYLPQDYLQRNPYVGFKPDQFQNLTNNPEYANLWLSNLSDNPQIDGRNFTFSCEIKMPITFYNSPCKVATISIQGTNEDLDFGFCIPNCTGALNFNFAGQAISGISEDLSQFGVNLSDWVPLKVEVLKNELKIMAQDLGYQISLPDTLGRVGGVNFIFDGIGAVRKVQFRDARQTIRLVE